MLITLRQPRFWFIPYFAIIGVNAVMILITNAQ
jgi:hypothetical protein